MDGQDTRQITVMIASRPYPLKIKESDEPAIRKIVKEVNEKINRFQLTYTTKDKQDCISMVLLTYAVELQKLKAAGGIPSETETMPSPIVSEKLSQLDNLLSRLLEE